MKVLTKNGQPILVEGKMICVDEITQISDVTINGDSIVVDGVAEIPLASDTHPGAVKTNLQAGVQISNGALLGMTKTSQQYSSGSNEMFISKGTLANIKESLVKSVVDKAWTLKGTLTTDIKDTGVSVDLTGCTELMVKSYINATGDINAILNGAYLGNCVCKIGKNGDIYYVGIWKDVDGFGVVNDISVYGVYNFDQLTPSYSAVIPYSYANIHAKIANTNAFKLTDTSNITECNIEIWAR